YPHLQFRFTDVEFGLRIDTIHGGVEDELTVRSEDLLTTHHTSLTESVERTHRKKNQETTFSGGAALQALLWTVPISYAGQHQQHTIEDSWRYQSTYEVKADRLER